MNYYMNVIKEYDTNIIYDINKVILTSDENSPVQQLLITTEKVKQVN